MKFLHISDLHLGKRINEFSMIEDQQYILTKIINIIDDEKPDGVLIAGDVYDKSVPSEEAIKLWDDFILRLSKRECQVFVIAGNHDSAVRLSGYRELIETSGIHISPSYDGNAKSFVLSDEYGELNVYLLPFVKPQVVRAAFPEEEITSYTEAVKTAIKHMNINKESRNVLVSHQFVTGAVTCESEEIVVGGIDNVSAEVFEDFDYTALGHIHGRQRILKDTIRYCGTPLKYSLSEKNHIKSVSIIDLKEKGNVTVSEKELIPLRDLREIKGTYDELTSKAFYENTNTKDYIHAVLTDPDDVPNALFKLRVIYPNLMKIKYDNDRTRQNQTISDIEELEKKSPLELFEEFFEIQNNTPMSEKQKELSSQLIDSIWSRSK